MIRIGVFGAEGRMGKTIREVVGEFEGVELGALIEKKGHPSVGTVVNGLTIRDNAQGTENSVDVYIDFTTPEATVEHVEFCRKVKKPMVIGTTGLSQDQMEFLKKASEEIPILYSPNMSYGVNVLFRAVEMLTDLLKDYDIEIVEAHHRFKKDSPSGTALRIGEVVAKTLGKSLEELEVYRGKGFIGEREKGKIGFSVIRAGDIVGEHTVIFAGPGEVIEIGHRALSRKTFAAGAVKAALWVRGRSPGLYSMDHVLGI